MLEEEVVQFLKDSGLEVDVRSPLSAKLPLLFLSEYNLAIQTVSITNPLLPDLLSTYFKELTGEAIDKNVKLIHLWEDFWEHRKEIIQSRLLALTGKSKRIPARVTEIVRLNKKEAEEFLNQNHLQGTTSAYYKYGLTYRNELVAVATFSKSRVMHDGPVYYRSYELERYANQLQTTVVGGLGKLLSHFIKEHNPAHLMTYVDRDWSEGNSYKKLGFSFAGNTEPQEFYIHQEEKKRYYPHRLPEEYTSTNELLKAGYFKIYNSGNAKWILDRRDQTS